MSAAFQPLRSHHANLGEVSEELRHIGRFLQELLVFTGAAPKSSDKGWFIVEYDGTTLKLHVRGQDGTTTTRKYKVIDNAA